jgi:hypothetical protein
MKPAVPPPLQAVCLRAMRRRPEERSASLPGPAHEVERWLADEPVRAYQEPWRVRLGRDRPVVAGALVFLATRKQDPDLDPLRQRDDFRELLAGLEAKAGGK